MWSYKKLQSRRSQSANSASSGNTIASNSSKRPRKRKNTEPSTNEPTRTVSNVKAQVGDKLKVYYGPTQSETKVTYEAKVTEISAEGMLRVHYTGWNTRYDEWIKPQRIAVNVSQHENRNKKGSAMNRRLRAKRIEVSSARSDSDTSDSDEEVKPPPNKPDEKSGPKTPRSKDAKSSDSSSSSKPRKRPVRTISTPTNVSPAKKPRPSTSHQGRDYDLNEIRSELKGFNTVKLEPDEIKQEPVDKDVAMAAIPLPAPPEPAQPEKQPEDVYEFKEPEPFELELHDEKKKRTHRIFDDISPSKYTSTLSKSLSEEINEDPLRPRPSTLRSPSLSPFRDFGATRDAGRQSPEDDSKDDLFSLDDDSFQGDCSSGPTFEGFTPAKNQETYSKKSKVSKLRKLIDDSPDSPADDEQSSDDEPDDVIKEEDEEEREPTPVLPCAEESKSSEPDDKEKVEEAEISKEVTIIQEIPEEILNIPEPPTTPPAPQQDIEFLNKIELPKLIDVPKIELPKKMEPAKKLEQPKKIEPPIKVELPKKIEIPKKMELIKKIELPKKLELPKTSIIVPVVTANTSSTLSVQKENPKEEEKQDEQIILLSIPLPNSEPKESILKIATPKKVEKLDLEPLKSKLEPPSSPLIDTEEEKSEPDSPARIDVLPEPPPGFLLQSEGPKIAEKLLKAISSAKRLSMSPDPLENRPETPKTDSLKAIKPESKLSPISPEPRTSVLKPEPIKPVVKISEPVKKLEDLIFGEPVNLLDVKRDVLDIKKKSEERTPPRLQSPLNILERRKSVAELPLNVPGKNNKVLSDTIQKLSSQINQAAASVAAIPLPTFPTEDRSESSDSDDSERRLIIDKLSIEEWGSGGSSEASRAAASGAAAGLRALHAEKSAGEWSAGESLLMLEDACKNERKHSASVVVAGSGRGTGAGGGAGTVAAPPAEEDSNLSLLLCEETIPGSPAPDAEPAPPRQRHHMPFASALPHHHNLAKDDRREGGSRAAAAAGDAAGSEGEAAGAGSAGWGRRPLFDNTPPTTPDSSLDMSPPRERRISERDSPSERKDDDDESRPNDAAMDIDKSSHAYGILTSAVGGIFTGGRSRKASESSAAGRGRRRARRDTDEHALGNHAHATLKYNFFVELDPTWDCQSRINLLTTRLADLRKAYHSVKAELAAVDRRRKKLRRKEREAVKAAKAACS